MTLYYKIFVKTDCKKNKVYMYTCIPYEGSIKKEGNIPTNYNSFIGIDILTLLSTFIIKKVHHKYGKRKLQVGFQQNFLLYFCFAIFDASIVFSTSGKIILKNGNMPRSKKENN